MKKKIRKAVAGILTMAVFSAIAFTGCTDVQSNVPFGDGTATDSNVVQTAPTDDDERTETPKYEGTIVQAGGSYDFCSNIAFLGADLTATSTDGDTFDPVSCELTATVEPADANQNVDWSVAFVDQSEDWATGKTVTDYISVSTATSGSTTATVTCKKPFSSQIKIICTSQENTDISAECTVDFMQAIKNVSLTYGDDLPINLGGITDIEVEVNPTNYGLGGDANLVIETYEDYTIAQEYSASIWKLYPSWYLNSDKITRDEYGDFMLDGAYKSNSSALSTTAYATKNDGYMVLNDVDYSVVCTYNNEWFNEFYTGMGSQSSLSSFVTQFSLYDYTKSTSLHTLSTEERIELFSNINNGYYCTVFVDIVNNTQSESPYYVRDYRMSLINVTGYTNNALVQSISFANSALKF